MIRTLMKNWWLLVLGGVFDAAYAITNLLTIGPNGSLAVRQFLPVGTVRHMGEFCLAAGVCTVAAGIWGSGRRKSWLLALNGFVLAAFGLFCVTPLPVRKISFLPFALAFAVMAISIGILALGGTRTLRRHGSDRWLLGLGGAASLAFALAFVVLGFHWVRLEPLPFLGWMSSYFAFSAVGMLAAGLRLNSLRGAIHRLAGATVSAG